MCCLAFEVVVEDEHNKAENGTLRRHNKRLSTNSGKHD